MKNKKFKCVGVAIPIDLYNLVRSAGPENVSFSKLVCSCLMSMYMPEESLSDFESNYIDQRSDSEQRSVDIEGVIDSWDR